MALSLVDHRVVSICLYTFSEPNCNQIVKRAEQLVPLHRLLKVEAKLGELSSTGPQRTVGRSLAMKAPYKHKMWSDVAPDSLL